MLAAWRRCWWDTRPIPMTSWRAAKALADERGLRVSAHMSPYADDAAWYVANLGRRPLEHLADLGVLGGNVAITHAVHIDHSELDILVASGAHVVHCPTSGLAMQGGYGLSAVGLFPEMLARGVNVVLGTDGAATDILSSARLSASVFRDARQDHDLIAPSTALEMATLGGAEAMGMAALIGSLEVGKKADFVLHDTYLPRLGAARSSTPSPSWVFCAPPRGVPSVWIDGVARDRRRASHPIRPRISCWPTPARQALRAEVAPRRPLPIQTTWPVI